LGFNTRRSSFLFQLLFIELFFWKILFQDPKDKRFAFPVGVSVVRDDLYLPIISSFPLFSPHGAFILIFG